MLSDAINPEVTSHSDSGNTPVLQTKSGRVAELSVTCISWPLPFEYYSI